MAVLDIVDDQFRIIEHAPDVTIDEIKNAAEGDVVVAENVKPMPV